MSMTYTMLAFDVTARLVVPATSTLVVNLLPDRRLCAESPTMMTPLARLIFATSFCLPESSARTTRPHL